MAAKRSAPPRARAAAAALTHPRTVRRGLLALVPSGRSLAFGAVLVAVAAGAYAVARETPLFAVRQIEVSGATPAVRAQVRTELAPLLGRSLVGLDGAAVVRRVTALPTVVSATYDRGFPHTLHVTVVRETPVAVLHRGTKTWLVSARGRVVSRIPAGTSALLPRIWLPTAAAVSVGAFLPAGGGGAAAQALALVGRFPARIATAATSHGELIFRLRSGIEVRFGEPTDVRLKLAIARRALLLLPPGTTYLDVSVPGRPVTGANPQLSGRD